MKIPNNDTAYMDLKHQANSIKYLEGSSNYTKVHFVDKSHMMISYTLNRVQEMINADFIRIHKGTAVNWRYIKQYSNANIELIGGINLSISRRRMKSVKLLLEATPCKTLS